MELIDEYAKFHITLNEDIKLTPNEYGEWDVAFKEEDIVNVTGLKSLANAIVILIMTRYGELKKNKVYKDDFGCRVHEIPKDNITNLNQYKVEKYIESSVKKMRRVKTINYIQVTPYQDGFNVVLSVTALNDEDLTLNMELN